MVQKTFVDMYGDAGGPAIPTIKNLVVKNNHVFFSPQNTSDVCAIIRNSTVTTANILLSGSTIKENNYERNSTGQIKYYDNVDPRNASEIEGVKTYSFYITDDSVASVNLGNINVNYARVGVDCTGANGLLRVTQGVTTTNTWGTLTNVTATSGVLTGTTGTDTTLNLSLQDGTLYVENRLGSTQRILVTVFAVI
jgi:hypothetical protein